MKINELGPYKSNQLYKKAVDAFPAVGSQGELNSSNRFDALADFTEYMVSKGFKELGMGSFGATFTHPNYPWVFKLFYNDPAYFKFFEYARANQSNPFLPKIKGKYIKIQTGVYVIRLEKLRAIQMSDWNEPGNNVVAALCDIYDLEQLVEKKGCNNKDKSTVI